MNLPTSRRNDSYTPIHLESKPNESQHQPENEQNVGYQSGAMKVGQDVQIHSGSYLPNKNSEHQEGTLLPPSTVQPNGAAPVVVVYQPVLINSKTPSSQPIQPQKKDLVQIKIEHLSPIPPKKDCIIACLIGGLFASFIVLFTGVLYIIYVQPTFGAITAIFGFASMVGLWYGIYAVPYYIKRIQKFLDDPQADDAEKIDQSCQRIVLNTYHYFIMLCFLGFLVEGIGIVAFKDDAKLEVKAMAYNQTKWYENFKDRKYEDVLNKFDIRMYALGGTCIAYSVIIALVICPSFSILNLYRKWQTIIEYVSVLLFQLGLVCIYFSAWVYRLKYVSETNDSLHTWVLIALILCAVIALVVGFIGFFSSFLENITFLRVTNYFSIVYMVFIFIVIIFGIAYICNLENFQNAKCGSLFLYFEESYLKEHFLCERKYVFVSDEIPFDSCPKDRITFAWEYEVEGAENKMYGCIDQNCCFNSYGSIRSKYDYLILIGTVLLCMGIFLCIGSHVVLKKLLKKKEEGIPDKVTFRIMGIAAIVTAIIIIIVIVVVLPGFSKRAYITEVDVDKTNDSDTQINSDSIFQPSKNDMNEEIDKSNEEIKNEIKDIIEKTTIPPPKVYQYTVTLNTGVTGKFVSTFSTSVNPNDKSTATPPSFEFTGQIELLKSFPDYLKFEPTCVLVPAKGKVTAKESGNSNDVYSQEIDYSKVYDKEIKITGKVNGKLDSDQAGKGGTFEFRQSTFTNCKQSITFQISGEEIDSGSTVFYGLKTNHPVEYEYTFTPTDSQNFEVYKSKVNIGGFAADSVVLEINLVQKIPPIKYGSFSGVVMNALTNKELSDVMVNLYEGTVEFSQEQMTSSTKSMKELFGTPKLSKKTDKNGKYSFESTVVGPYTLIFTKNDFLSDKLLLNLEEGSHQLSTISLSPKLEKGSIRVVLSWIDKPKDLDIHSIFQINSSKKCHVFFGNKNCVGLSLDVDNTKGGKNGVETITFKELGKYIYTFYVHQYSDESGGRARGENAISGVVQNATPDDGTKSLKLSGAKIIIYGYGYNTPISIIQVNTANNGNTRDRYWIPFCLNGEKGITSLKVINKLQSTVPTSSYCESFYK